MFSSTLFQWCVRCRACYLQSLAIHLNINIPLLSQWYSPRCCWRRLVRRQSSSQCCHSSSSSWSSPNIQYTCMSKSLLCMVLKLILFQLYAKGGEDGPEHNRAHRLVNAWELAKLARQAAELGKYVIAVFLLPLFQTLPLAKPVSSSVISTAFQQLYP